MIHRQNFTISGHSKLCSWGVYLSPQISAGHRKATTRSHSTYSTTCITRLLTLIIRDFVLAKPAYESLVTSHVRDQVMVTPVFVVEIKLGFGFVTKLTVVLLFIRFFTLQENQKSPADSFLRL